MDRQPITAKTAVAKAFEQATQAPLVTANDVQIWGGVLPAADLAGFLNAWRQVRFPFAWAMVEEVSRFYVLTIKSAAEAVPEPAYTLEAARLFGSAGDLALRRDGEQIRWHFVGDAGQAVPELASYQAVNYWTSAAAKGRSLRRVEKRYRQWNRNEREQRVTHAWAAGVFDAKTPVWLDQAHYLDHGQVAFVRYVRLVQEGTGAGR